jgi:hypothetical protein
VFASHPCHHHTGFLGFDAAYVTVGMRLAYLGCLSGGGGVLGPQSPVSEVAGEIVFFDGQEFPSPVWDWVGVPEPAAGQRRVAYVAVASGRDLLNGDGTSAAVSSFMRITDETRGVRGYPFALGDLRFSTAVVPFALAGLEDIEDDGMGSVSRSFVPYVVGLGQPVVIPPSRVRSGIEIRMDTPVGPGRTVTANLPPTVPTLGVTDDPFGDHLFMPGTLDRLQLLVRYAVPGLAAGLPLGLGEDSDQPSGSASAALSIARQPQAIGSFAAAEQEIFAILAPEQMNSDVFYDKPHTRVLLRAPLDVNALTADGFLGIADFTVPASFDAPLPTDRTLRFALEHAEGATLIRITVSIPFSVGLGLLWQLFAHPSVRSVTLPDLSSETNYESLTAGRHLISIGVYDVPSLDFDRIDTRSIDSLPPRRSSFNVSSFTVE